MNPVNPIDAGRQAGEDDRALPFYSFSRGLFPLTQPRDERPASSGGSLTPSDPPTRPGPAARAYSGRDDFDIVFEAAVKGVRTGFSHLSEDDIAHPPHEWFDAALARQIAYHLMVNRYGVPKRRIVAELQRTRAMLARAMEAIEERMLNETFSHSYEAMAAQADHTLIELRKAGRDNGAD